MSEEDAMKLVLKYMKPMRAFVAVTLTVMLLIETLSDGLLSLGSRYKSSQVIFF